MVSYYTSIRLPMIPGLFALISIICFLQPNLSPSTDGLKYYIEFLNLPIPDISGLVFVPISHPIHPIPWSFDEKGMAMLPSAAL